MHLVFLLPQLLRLVQEHQAIYENRQEDQEQGEEQEVHLSLLDILIRSGLVACGGGGGVPSAGNRMVGW